MPLTTVSDVNTFSLWASHACSKQQQNPVCHIISSLPSFYSSFDLCCCCCLKSSGRRAHCSVNVCVCPFVYGLHFQWGYKRKKTFDQYLAYTSEGTKGWGHSMLHACLQGMYWPSGKPGKILVGSHVCGPVNCIYTVHTFIYFLIYCYRRPC